MVLDRRRKAGGSHVMQTILSNDNQFEFYPETNGKPLEGFKQSEIMIECVLWKDCSGYLEVGDWIGVWQNWEQWGQEETKW